MSKLEADNVEEGTEDIVMASGALEETEEASEDDEVYVVEKIIKHRTTKNGQKQFLLKWEGYPDSENTWEDEDNILDKEMLTKYWEAKSTRATPRGRKSNGAASKAAGGTPKETPSRQNKRRRTVDSNVASDDDAGEDGSDPTMFSFDEGPEAANWEPLIQEIETIDRQEDNGLVVWIVWKNGERTMHPSEVTYKKCPQAMLKFYEERLRFRSK